MVFVGRFIIFLSLWFLMIYTISESVIVSYFMFTICLMMYFFLSQHHAHPLLYMMIVIVLFIHGFIIYDVIYSGLLILLITSIAATRLIQRWFYSLLGISTILFMVLVLYHASIIVPFIFIVVLYGFFSMKLNQIFSQKNHFKSLYMEVNNENRTLNRMRTLAETVAKTEERNRIAREIHDSVGHRLTALMMKLEMLHIEHQDSTYAELKKMANDSLQETREAVQTLQTSDVKGIPAVVQLIRKLEAESHLLIQFTIKEGVLSVPISNNNGVVLYRVIQEALTNVMRHADSRHVSITIGQSAIQSLSFEISNPIRKRQDFSLGFGLTNMVNRMREIGGTLDIYETNTSFVISGMMPSEEE